MNTHQCGFPIYKNYLKHPNLYRHFFSYFLNLTNDWSLTFFREKFWRVGNKERDGEYGACFYSHNKGLLGQSPLLYCARPGSRIWEANFNGEVLSTHQFKQLLACPPLPLITYRQVFPLSCSLDCFRSSFYICFYSACREEPRYNPELRTPQSLAFPKLLHFG